MAHSSSLPKKYDIVFVRDSQVDVANFKNEITQKLFGMISTDVCELRGFRFHNVNGSEEVSKLRKIAKQSKRVLLYVDTHPDRALSEIEPLDPSVKYAIVSSHPETVAHAKARGLVCIPAPDRKEEPPCASFYKGLTKLCAVPKEALKPIQTRITLSKLRIPDSKKEHCVAIVHEDKFDVHRQIHRGFAEVDALESNLSVMHIKDRKHMHSILQSADSIMVYADDDVFTTHAILEQVESHLLIGKKIVAAVKDKDRIESIQNQFALPAVTIQDEKDKPFHEKLREAEQQALVKPKDPEEKEATEKNKLSQYHELIRKAQQYTLKKSEIVECKFDPKGKIIKEELLFDTMEAAKKNQAITSEKNTQAKIFLDAANASLRLRVHALAAPHFHPDDAKQLGKHFLASARQFHHFFKMQGAGVGLYLNTKNMGYAQHFDFTAPDCLEIDELTSEIYRETSKLLSTKKS